ncbi:MAG TPA: wax ester/triacylglycerol synthase domain-containing protein, partial [Myxococcales bacterium]|nr:wax ester/triacylglycerol synthase domain-containing protein [Myxococcales bacterium]
MTAERAAGSREPMSPADAAWLQMDRPTNRMIISALLTFDGPLDPGALQRTLLRVAALPRFHQRVFLPGILPGRPEWRDDPAFDLGAHVRHLAAPAPGGNAGLRQLVSDRMSARLPLSKALWEVDVIDGGGGASALLLRVHHCIGDGIALVSAMLGLADEPAAAPPEPQGRREKSFGPLAWAGQQLIRAGTFGRMLALPADPPTPFRGPTGPAKRAAWSAPVPLPHLRALAREHRATVNDVLMGTLAGVLREWLIHAGREVPDRDIRALVPVFLGGRNAAMGNRFGMAFVDLPLGEPDAGARIRALKKSMDAIKASPMAPVAFDVLRFFGIAGRAVEKIGVDIFTRKATVMVTNVPGPRSRIRLAGRELESVMVWAPTSGGLGLSVTLLTYGGEL